jgi:hypothetical protein
MNRFSTRFRLEQNGSMTADWIILTAGILALSVASFALLMNGSTDLSQTTSTQDSTISVGSN